MKRIVSFMALMCAAAFAQAGVVSINNAELLRLQAKGVPVVDVRTPEEWRETGVIKGARLLTYSFSGGFDKAAWLKQVQQIAKPGEPVILMCRSGRRSTAVAEFMESQPAKGTIYNANDGMNAWKAEGRPTVAP